MILRKLILLVLTLGLVNCTVTKSNYGEASGQQVLMFSTDYGLGLVNGATNGPDNHAADADDAYAVTLALAASQNVQAIVSIFGNDKAKPSHESIRRGLAALDYPSNNVFLGAEGFIDAKPVSFSVVGQTPAIYCVNNGVNKMRNVLDANPANTVTLFALGPLTDIACLRRAYPSSYQRLKEIIALIGSADGKPLLEGRLVTDFNFAMDPTATGLVIQNSPVSITLLMFEVTQLGTLSNQVLNDWITFGTPAQKYYGNSTKPHAQYWDAIFTKTDGQALFDAHPVYYFLNPQQYQCNDNMLATAIIKNYPDTDAKTTQNKLMVQGVNEPITSTTDGTEYKGKVRGCYAFANDQGIKDFELAVKDSVKSRNN